MANHSISFEPTDTGMVLTSAILMYRSDGPSSGQSSAPAFASMHSIEHGDGAPTIAAGVPLAQSHLRQWTKALGQASPPQLLPGNVLVSHPDMLAWWVPEQVRTAYFALSRPPEGLKALAGRCSHLVPYPAHLFVATRTGLGVYALAKSERPAPDTQLLCSPVLNVFNTGSLCWGNVRRPRVPTVAAVPEYEAAVFDSWSTHPNSGQELSVTGKGGLVRLWDDLAARKAKRFPVARLSPFTGGRGRKAKPITLNMLVCGNDNP